LTLDRDDAIVVVMTTDEYLYSTEETNRIRELAAGRVREPPAPFWSHQELVLKVARLIGDHVEPRNLGRVAVAPVDVVLDRAKNLVLQPDVVFISTARLSIIRDQVWGAPDLVVEVLSHSSRRYDRGPKLDWYEQYGIRECWLVDLYGDQVIVVDFTSGTRQQRVAHGARAIRSSVLPDLQTSAFGVLA
jgi:Uma2 family endonuclease